MSPKGRPTDNPKKGRFEIRTSEEEEMMLNYCCEKTGKNRTDIVRIGIRKVYEELKNKKVAPRPKFATSILTPEVSR